MPRSRTLGHLVVSSMNMVLSVYNSSQFLKQVSQVKQHAFHKSCILSTAHDIALKWNFNPLLQSMSISNKKFQIEICARSISLFQPYFPPWLHLFDWHLQLKENGTSQRDQSSYLLRLSLPIKLNLEREIQQSILLDGPASDCSW